MACCLTARSYYLSQCQTSHHWVPVVITWRQFLTIYLSHQFPKLARILLSYIKYHPNLPGAYELTHWGRVTHICVNKLAIIGSDNGLSLGRRQAIIWTSPGILLIGPLGTNFSEIRIEIYSFSLKKMHLKMASGKCRPFCLGLNVLSAVAKTFTGLIRHACSTVECLHIDNAYYCALYTLNKFRHVSGLPCLWKIGSMCLTTQIL